MKLKRIIAIALVVVAVAMVGVGIYFMNSSKYIFKKALSSVFDYAIDTYDEMTDSLEELEKFDEYKINTTNSAILDEVEIANISGDIYIDSKEEKFYTNLDSTIMSEEFIGGEFLLENDKIYLKLKEAMKNFYYQDLEMSEMLNTEIEGLTDEEFELLMEHLEDSMLKDLKGKDISKSTQTIKLDDKNVKTTKVSLKMTEKRIMQITENFLVAIRDDKKAIQILQKYSKEITKDSIDELVKELKKSKSAAANDELFTLSFYVEGFGKSKRAEISISTGDIDGVASEFSISYDKYKNKHKQTTSQISITEGKQSIVVIKKEHVTKNKSNLLVQVEGNDIATGTIIETDNSVSYKIDIHYDDVTVASIEYENDVVKEDKEYKLNISVTVNDLMYFVVAESSSMPQKLTFESNNTLLIGEKIPAIDTNGAISFDEVTDKELEDIQKFIEEKIESIVLSGTSNLYENYYGNEEVVKEDGYDTSYFEETGADKVEELMKSEEPMVLWFGSQNCSHCASFADVLNKSYFDYYYSIYYIDINTLTDSDREILKTLDNNLNVTSTPTVFVLQDGKIKDSNVGAMSEDDYYDFLDKNGVE